MRRRYAIAIENAGSNYSAYVLDLPGCTTSGKTVEEVKRNMVEAIRLHLDGEPEEEIPPPSTIVDYVEIAEDNHRAAV